MKRWTGSESKQGREKGQGMFWDGKSGEIEKIKQALGLRPGGS